MCNLQESEEDKLSIKHVFKQRHPKQFDFLFIIFIHKTRKIELFIFSFVKFVEKTSIKRKNTIFGFIERPFHQA